MKWKRKEKESEKENRRKYSMRKIAHGSRPWQWHTYMPYTLYDHTLKREKEREEERTTRVKHVSSFIKSLFDCFSLSTSCVYWTQQMYSVRFLANNEFNVGEIKERERERHKSEWNWHEKWTERGNGENGTKHATLVICRVKTFIQFVRWWRC